MLEFLFERVPFRVVQTQTRSRDVFFQVRDPRCPRDGQHHRRVVQQPRHRQLRYSRTMSPRRLIQRSAGTSEFTGSHREPGNEGDIVILAVLQHRFMLAIEKIVAVLHTDDGNCLLCPLDLGHRNFGEPDVPDLAFLLCFLQSASALFNGHLRVDAMELIQIDSFHAEIAQAHLQFLPQIFGTSDWRPGVRALPGQPAFGRNY